MHSCRSLCANFSQKNASFIDTCPHTLNACQRRFLKIVLAPISIGVHSLGDENSNAPGEEIDHEACGKQLKAARVAAGVSQRRLKMLGVHEMWVATWSAAGGAEGR